MAREKRRDGGDGWALVRRCPACGREEGKCVCKPAPAAGLPPQKQRPRFRLEKRRGKPVTVVTHLQLSGAALKELAGRLRARLGTGGTQGEGEIELQGDHREALAKILAELGFKT